jgi:hypothetical protein
MNNKFWAALFLGLMAVSTATNAELVEGLCDGNPDTTVTCDTDTGLEWLDLTETLGLSASGFLADEGGWRSAGWSFATGSMVDQLFLNAGAVSLDNTTDASNENKPAVLLLLSLLGATHIEPGFADFGSGFASGGSAPFYLRDRQGLELYKFYGSSNCCLPPTLTSDGSGIYAFREGGGTGNSIAMIVALADINGNGFPEVAAFIEGSTNHVQVRDGSTDALITDIDFGTDLAIDMVVLPDLDASGDPEIAILQQQPSGQVRVQARDSVTGGVTSNLWYGLQYEPVSMTVVPDYNTSGFPEVAVLGSEAGTDAVRVQVRDSDTGTFLDNVFLGTQSIATDLVSVTDTSGNSIPEIGIMGVLKANDHVRMQIWDAQTSAFQSNVWFGNVYQPHSTITMPDINNNGSDEIVAMGVDPATQNIRVQVRDSDTTVTLYNIWLGAVNEAVDIALINDINSDGVADLAVLLKTPAGVGRVRVQSGLNGAFIRNLFYSVVENPVGLAVMPDYSGNGFDELAVLGENAGVRHVQILDTSSGAQVNRIDFLLPPVTDLTWNQGNWDELNWQ